jgi:hypothetical protein
LLWTGGVGINPPTTNDVAAFNLAATYSIDLTISPTVSGVQVGGSNVTFTNGTAGRTFHNNGTLIVSAGSFNLAASNPVNWTNSSTAFFNANATVSNGNDFSAPLIGVGNSGNATVTFTAREQRLPSRPASRSAAAPASPAPSPRQQRQRDHHHRSQHGHCERGVANLNLQSGATFSTSQGMTIGTSRSRKRSQREYHRHRIDADQHRRDHTRLDRAQRGDDHAQQWRRADHQRRDLNVTSTGLIDVQSGGVFHRHQPRGRGWIGQRHAGEDSRQRRELELFADGQRRHYRRRGRWKRGDDSNQQRGAFSTGTSGVTINPAGLVDIAGGSFNLNGNATVNGTLQRGAAGTLNWATGKTMTVQNGGDVVIAGAYTLPNTASITVTGAGHR